MAYRTRNPDVLLAGGGETTIPRNAITTNALTLTSQSLVLCPFFSSRSEPITKVRMRVGATIAGTVTLIRVGIYEVDVNGALILVASIANTTTMMGTANAASTLVSLSATWNKVVGRMYAAGVLFNGTTAPTVWGGQIAYTSTATVNPFDLLPYAGPLRKTVQTDLPTSVAKSALSILTATQAPYVELLP
jgi:hypothetical protein